ncbi:MAG TPA: hypothetical protein VMF60_08920 [Acidimicrobiales bacterium]|nr:hypothetical protein [Acidimicrobiales bacterium]
MHTATTTGLEQVPSSSASAGAGRSLVLSDVLLLTAESGGRVAVPGLRVEMDQTAVTVRKPDGDIGAVVIWEDVSRLGVAGRMPTPLGPRGAVVDGVIVEAVTAAKTHRFVVPTEDPDGLEREIAKLSAVVVPRRRRGASGLWRHRFVFVSALVIVVAGIALGVLAATGVVSF